MRIRFPRRTPAAIAAATALALAAMAGTAAAVLSGSSGTSQIQIVNKTDNAPTSTNAVAWTNLPPGSEISVTVPNGTTRLVNARFTAESKCSSGGNLGHCSVRIVAIGPAGTIELDPVSGIDFAFDDDNADGPSARAVERSIRLGPGVWRLVVQRAVTNAAIGFTLDDWHFAVEVSA